MPIAKSGQADASNERVCSKLECRSTIKVAFAKPPLPAILFADERRDCRAIWPIENAPRYHHHNAIIRRIDFDVPQRGQSKSNLSLAHIGKGNYNTHTYVHNIIYGNAKLN